MLKYSPFAAFATVLLASPLQALADEESWHDRHAREYRWERHHHTKPEGRPVARNDSQPELPQSTPTPARPATHNMGVGSSDIALGLAKASLAKHGIHNPTPEQIKAALNGGTVTTKSGQRVTLPGVLKLRASGMGWGQIAQKIGVKVGDVKGHGHAHKKHDDKHHHKHARHHDHDDDDDRHHHRKHVKNDHKHKHDKHEHKHVKHHKHDWKHDRHEHKHQHAKHHHHHRPEFHRAKFDRPERAHRPDKVERPHRAERPERPEGHRHRH